MPYEPTFIIIGAPKAGTTTLWHILSQHPDVYMCPEKEPKFFSWDDRYSRGWDWYTSLFNEAGSQKALGEASTNYCMTELYPNTVQRIKRHLPDIRIIFCVRHPLDRIESAWKQCIYSGYNISSNFSEAIHSFPRLFQSGRYLQTLTEYRNAFGVENVNVIFFDDLITNPVGYIKQVTDFIGVDSTNHIDIKPQNVTNSKRIERHYIGWLRGIGVNRILPRGLKRSLPKNLINKPLPKANWNADTRAYAVALISDEIHEFLRQMGKPEDFWKL